MDKKAGRRRVALTSLAIVAAVCGGSNQAEGTNGAPPMVIDAASAAHETPSTGTGAATDVTTPPSEASTPVEAKRTTYPVDVIDCQGRTTTYEKAPERIATFDPTIAETLIELGLTDKIVGVTQWGDTDWWPKTEAEMRTLTIINEAPNYPTKEAVVAASPDIVMSIYPSALLSNKTLPNRDEWAGLGVDSYLVKTGCDEVTGELVDFSSLYEDIRNIGVIFDVQGRAEELIARMERDVASLRAKVDAAGLTGKTVWTYDASDDNGVFDGNSPENAIMRLSGMTNIFADSLEGYTSMSIEQVVERNPDLIWIVTSSGEGFIEEGDQLLAALVGDARVNGLGAVKNKQYFFVSYSDAVPSPRIIDALSDFVDAVIALK